MTQRHFHKIYQSYFFGRLLFLTRKKLCEFSLPRTNILHEPLVNFYNTSRFYKKNDKLLIIVKIIILNAFTYDAVLRSLHGMVPGNLRNPQVDPLRRFPTMPTRKSPYSVICIPLKKH